MKIAIYGHGGSENHGNEAIVRGVHEVFPDADLQLFSFSPAKDCFFGLDQIADVIAINKQVKGLKNLVLKLKKQGDCEKQFYYFLRQASPDTIYCLEAGDQYCDVPQLRRWYAFLNKKLHEKNAKTVMLGCSITEDVINDPAVEKDLRTYNAIIARESLTYNLLVKKSIPNVYLLPCPAFAMQAEATVLPACFAGHEVIGFNIGFLQQNNEQYLKVLLENYANAIQFVLEKTGYNVLLIPHVHWNYQLADMRTLEKLYARFKASNRVFLCEERNAPQIKYILSKLKVFVSLRTHAQVPALAACVPTVIAGYKHKSIGISNDVYGVSSPMLCHVQMLANTHTVKDKLEYALQHNEEIRRLLSAHMPSYIKRLQDLRDIFNRL